jgi:HD-like signal output (HDOD) protein
MDRTEIDKKDEVMIRIREIGDLPGMAETIHLIKKLRSSEDTAITEITNLILRDYALTIKLLKVVNSVLFLQFGQVTTISRAIFLLGLERIKQIALSLFIFEQLEAHHTHPLILDVISQAFFGGFFAKRIVHNLDFVEEEEAFICALIHPLGKILVAFAWPEKIFEIHNLSQDEQISENSAAVKVLGVSFEEIGITMASEWNFPPRIVQSMHIIPPTNYSSEPGAVARLAMVAHLATEISNELVLDLEKKKRKEKISAVLSGYKETFPVPENWEQVISTSIQDLNNLDAEFNRKMATSFFRIQLEEWSVPEGGPKPEEENVEHPAEALQTIDTFFPVETEDSPETVFTKGIHDINSSVLHPFALEDIVRIALETIHRGMKTADISNTLFFVKDTKKSQMRIRFGFGESIKDYQKWFVIELGEGMDIFNSSLNKSADLIVRDTHSPRVKHLIPVWYRKYNPRPCYLILLPIVVSKKVIGLVCLEGETAGVAIISKGHFNYLKILRDQIVLAITRLASKI